MKRKSPSKSPSKAASVSRRAFSAGLGAVGFTAGIAPFNIVRAQGAALKVGVLLPRSGFQAGIGQDGLGVLAQARHLRAALQGRAGEAEGRRG